MAPCALIAQRRGGLLCQILADDDNLYVLELGNRWDVGARRRAVDPLRFAPVPGMRRLPKAAVRWLCVRRGAGETEFWLCTASGAEYGWWMSEHLPDAAILALFSGIRLRCEPLPDGVPVPVPPRTYGEPRTAAADSAEPPEARESPANMDGAEPPEARESLANMDGAEPPKVRESPANMDGAEPPKAEESPTAADISAASGASRGHRRTAEFPARRMILPRRITPLQKTFPRRQTGTPKLPSRQRITLPHPALPREHRRTAEFPARRTMLPRRTTLPRRTMLPQRMLSRRQTPTLRITTRRRAGSLRAAATRRNRPSGCWRR